MLMSMKLEVLDFVKKLLKTMLVEALRRDVIESFRRGDVMDGDLALTDKLTNLEEP